MTSTPSDLCPRLVLQQFISVHKFPNRWSLSTTSYVHSKFTNNRHLLARLPERTTPIWRIAKLSTRKLCIYPYKTWLVFLLIPWSVYLIIHLLTAIIGFVNTFELQYTKRHLPRAITKVFMLNVSRLFCQAMNASDPFCSQCLQQLSGSRVAQEW